MFGLGFRVRVSPNSIINFVAQAAVSAVNPNPNPDPDPDPNGKVLSGVTDR